MIKPLAQGQATSSQESRKMATEKKRACFFEGARERTRGLVVGGIEGYSEIIFRSILTDRIILVYLSHYPSTEIRE